MGDNEPSIEEEAGSDPTEEQWTKVLAKVIPAVVELSITVPFSFDTFQRKSDDFTGFIVDKSRGIILTTRQVLTAGPVVGHVVFSDQQQVPIHPIYRDPVHNFGFCCFDTSRVEPEKLVEIPLAPEGAAVGMEIRVLSNGGADRLTISSAILAGLNEDAPAYDDGKGYNDFNISYMQADWGQVERINGAPVIDCRGRAIGLSARPTGVGTHGYFLPLDRIVRVLKIVQKSKDECTSGGWPRIHVPRGTLQTTLVSRGFGELRRLRIGGETERCLREGFDGRESRMLVVDSVQPGGPAAGILRPGDVLVAVGGSLVTKFSPLEAFLDDNVGRKIHVVIDRGGALFGSVIKVQDLHSITPNYFVTFEEAVIHPLSYQMARNYHLQCGLVYVAEPGYLLSQSGISRGHIITKLAGTEIYRPEHFAYVLSKVRPGATVGIEFFNPGKRNLKQFNVVTVHPHKWFENPQLYSLHDALGSWAKRPATILSPADYAEWNPRSPLPKRRRMIEGSRYEQTGSRSSAEGPVNGNFAVLRTEGFDKDEEYLRMDKQLPRIDKYLQPSLVVVRCMAPSQIDGLNNKQSCCGTGLVVYHSSKVGLVLIGRNFAPTAMCDISLTFPAISREISAEVVFVHPMYNFTFIAYETPALGPGGAASVRSASLLPDPVNRRDVLCAVALDNRQQATQKWGMVENPRSILRSPSVLYQRREVNLEVIGLKEDMLLANGVLANEIGYIRGLFDIFLVEDNTCPSNPPQKAAEPFSIYTANHVFKKIMAGTRNSPWSINQIRRACPRVHLLEVEFSRMNLAQARNYGLRDEWVRALELQNPLGRQVLVVDGCFAGSKARDVLKARDILLAINREPVSCIYDIQRICHMIDDCKHMDERLKMRVLRGGSELDLVVGTDLRDGLGTTHIVDWCGALIQSPYPAVRSLGYSPEGNGVCYSKCKSGSPMDSFYPRLMIDELMRLQLPLYQWIVQVNGKPTPDLQTFINVVKDLDHEECVLIDVVDMLGEHNFIIVNPDPRYHPTWERIFDPRSGTWMQRTIKALKD